MSFFSVFSPFYRVQSDFEFYKNRKSFSNYLSNCKGVLNYSDYEDKISKIIKYLIVNKSILYPKKRSIHTIIIRNNLDFPKRLLEPDFKLEQRFFNFTPLYEVYSQGISTSSN